MRHKKILILIVFLCIVLSFTCDSLAQSTDLPDYIYVIPVKGIIDKGMAAFVTRVIREAEQVQAKALVIEIDTPGGEVGSAIQVSKAILNTFIPTVSFINNEATSAGVIIAISSKTLVATPGATIGAAETRPKEEKYISYWSSALRATAEKTGRNPELVAAMADADIVIEGIKEKGKILSLTTGEALELGLIDEQINNLEDIVNKIKTTQNIENVEVIKAEMNLSERIAHLVSNPYIAPVILTIGIVGIVTEILTPGFGIPGIIGLMAIGLFFGGTYMAGAAKIWVIGLFVLGLLLLLVEMFIPGFGVFGVTGILSIIASVILAFPTPEQALVSILITLVSSIVLIYLLLKYVIKAPIFERIVLSTKQAKSEGYVTAIKDESQLVGAVGKAITPLRPAGVALIGERRLDVLAEGGFIPSNSDIIVSKVEGNKIIVKLKVKESV
ncbi:nodulation protein NfeD [Tepidanaerobacter sp. GT38]|uniref:NfeD family protein n=1 Tax=Tepidanaerobacter sp. GT38 TaxID=2722793 RepID=UPI001F29273C|nr:NfeD family protein [Tepidanaerobacter sp. GT38]MCG1012710.1 nodulation protein NfeD [Tepidanaerobacter sp. GT38]